uniref:Uncharacterized protein n=1 Tax=Oryza rufipogon TaxID=4529 RepID=A0A0E0Q6H2_ORYRU
MPLGGGMNHCFRSGQGGAGFHPPLITCESTADAPMIQHRSTSADIPRHTHQQLLLASWSPPLLPTAPHRAPLAYSTTRRASGASPASRHQSRLSHQAGLHRHQTRLSHQSGLLPSAAPLCAKPASDGRSPTLAPIAVAPARCSHLPSPQLAVRDHHASPSSHGHHHRASTHRSHSSRCC